jgi:peptidoglycan hydrolase CwlO-like protein
LNKQQQILALTEKVDTLTTQLDAAGEALANDQNAEAAKIAELAAMLAKAEETVRALTRERGILRSQVTRLKKGRKAPSTEQVSGKEIKRQIALVRAELFQYIFERTSAVERLEAYIKEQVDWPKT